MFGDLQSSSWETFFMTPNTNHTIANSLQIPRQQSRHAVGQFHEPAAVVSQSFHLALLSIEGINVQGVELNSVTDGETARNCRLLSRHYKLQEVA